MKDHFGRTVDYLRVSVTDRCNERCLYCMPAEGLPSLSHRDILTYDEIVRVVRAAASCGVHHIRLTGGEPLVRKNLPALVAMLKEVPGIESLSLTTNGTLLSDQIDDLVKAGITAVNLSLDTLDPDFYHRLTRVGHLEDALKGLESALRYPYLTLKADCVVLGLPEQKLLDVAALATDKPVHVRFIELMPIGLSESALPGGTEASSAAWRALPSRLEEAFGPYKPVDDVPGHGPANYVKFDGLTGRIGFIGAVSHRFCDACNRMRLMSAGYLKSCLQYDTGVDLRAILRGGSDAALREAFARAVSLKPDGHHFGEGRTPDDETHTMNTIGG